LKKTIEVFTREKGKEKIAVLTAYDFTTAALLNSAQIDAILVGDSLGMVFQGYNDTLRVTIDEIIYHTKSVRRGAPDSFLIADMPFLSFQVSPEDTIRNAGRLVKEGFAEAVKLEGGEEIIDKVKALIAAKIPVMGHLGLTPQSVNIFGGYKVQGKSLAIAKKILSDALLLEQSGVFAIVLEGISERLAKLISEKLTIPTIGIGAGRFTDGQVLVINDIFGTYGEFSPKFAKKFANVSEEMEKSVLLYINEVKTGKFPEEKHTFKIDDEIINALL